MNKHSVMLRLLACIAVLGWVCPVWAARPFVTDDARLTTAGSCQVESWTRFYSASQEFWALPACNLTGNLEVTLGGGLATTTGMSTTTDNVFQLKTLFKTLQTNSWGIGLAAGRILHPEINPGPNQLGNTYAYIPFSASFNNDRFILHANSGWLRDNATSQDRTTWGLGGEFQFTPRLALMAETFGDDVSRPYWQTGVRFWLIPSLFQVDATLGQQAGGNSATQWLSLGLRWVPEKLFGKLR